MKAIVGALALLVFVAAPAASQTPDTLTLDLAKVAELAAARSASVEVERLGAVEAEARVREDRAALLPHVSVEALQGNRTFNTASFGIEFPTPAGQEVITGRVSPPPRPRASRRRRG